MGLSIEQGQNVSEPLDGLVGSTGVLHESEHDEEKNEVLGAVVIAAKSTMLVPRQNDVGSDEESSEGNDTTEEHDEEASEEELVEFEDDTERMPRAKSSVMANVMARILHSGREGSPNVCDEDLHSDSISRRKRKNDAASAGPVLSMTTTKLRKAQMDEKELELKFYNKRRQNREEKLQCMRIPSSWKKQDPSKATNEIQLERAHKRIATKGVVALFNSIAQHQNGKRVEASDASNLFKTSKIKESRTSGDARNVSPSLVSTSKEGDDEREVKWSALKDDFMMKTKPSGNRRETDNNSVSDDESTGDFASDDDDLSI